MTIEIPKWYDVDRTPIFYYVSTPIVLVTHKGPPIYHQQVGPWMLTPIDLFTVIANPRFVVQRFRQILLLILSWFVFRIFIYRMWKNLEYSKRLHTKLFGYTDLQSMLLLYVSCVAYLFAKFILQDCLEHNSIVSVVS